MRRIFVFGSNLAGVHGAGSARYACMEKGAVYGCGIGLQGNSYAIPTKDEYIDSLSLNKIQIHIRNFISFAENNPEMEFDIVAIGCGLAGFAPEQIAPMFKNAPKNCNLPKEFTDIINKETK